MISFRITHLLIIFHILSKLLPVLGDARATYNVVYNHLVLFCLALTIDITGRIVVFCTRAIVAKYLPRARRPSPSAASSAARDRRVVAKPPQDIRPDGENTHAGPSSRAADAVLPPVPSLETVPEPNGAGRQVATSDVRLAELEQTIAHLRAELAASNEKHAEDLAAKDEVIATLARAKEAQRVEFAATRSRLAFRLKSRNDWMNALIQDKFKQSDETDAQLRAEKEKTAKQQGKVAAQRKKNAALKEQNAVLQEENATLKSEIGALEDAVSALQASVDERDARVARRDTTIARKNNIIADLRSDVHNLGFEAFIGRLFLSNSQNHSSPSTAANNATVAPNVAAANVVSVATNNGSEDDDDDDDSDEELFL